MTDLPVHLLGLLFGVGTLAGFVDSIAGGGGIITIPALLSVGIPPHLALGTNKLQSCFGSLTAALNYRNGQLVRFRELASGILFTAVGACAGTAAIQAIAPDILARVIPVLLVAILVYMLFNPGLGATRGAQRLSRGIFYLVFGSLLGFYDGFFGPGTGSFWTLAITLLLGLDLKTATAQTKVFNFTSNIVSLLTFLAGGHVIFTIGIIMGTGQVLGAFAGSHLVIRRGTRFVRVIFLIVVTATMAKLLYNTYL